MVDIQDITSLPTGKAVECKRNLFPMKFILKILTALTLLSGSQLQALPKHQGPSYDTKPRNALDTFAETLAKQNKLKLLLSGLGCIGGSKTGLWGLHFTSSEKMTLEQARPFAAQIGCELVNFMYANPLFNEYFPQADKDCPQPWKSNSLSLDDMSYKIAFWDEKVRRPTYPYLAQIRLCDGQLYYYYADPKDQALKDPIIDSLYKAE